MGSITGNSFIVDIIFLFCNDSSRLIKELFAPSVGNYSSSLHFEIASDNSFLVSGWEHSRFRIILIISPTVFLTYILYSFRGRLASSYLLILMFSDLTPSAELSS
jgi:hypothetical protein